MNYAKDSTIDISPDWWGNLVVYVNGEDVVVMPKPFAIDAAGQRLDMDFKLDKKAKTITVAGDLAEAKYPVTVDPTERVTNGGFETGNTSGWSGPYLVASSGDAHQGTYYLDVVGSGGYTSMSQSISYTGATSVSNTAAIPVTNIFDIPMSDIPKGGWHWLVNAPGQYIQSWTYRSTSPGLTGQGNIVIWTYSSTHGHIDSVSVLDLPPPVAQFTGTPLTGIAPLTVQFTDQSTNAPTSWSWTFGDGGTSTAQNPGHQYTSAGTYTVSLTATNAAGSDGETKTDYVTVSAPQTTYTVFVEGVSDYPVPPYSPLGSAAPLAQTFYQNIVGSENNGIFWTGYGEYYNSNAASRHWSASEVSAIKADHADFALFAGHGGSDYIHFSSANSVGELPRSDMQFGGSKLKWLTLSSCSILHEPTQTNWNSVFNGLHILNSYETEGLLYDRQGGIYAAYLTGGFFEGEYFAVQTIRDAWRKTLEKTIGSTEYFGASKWAEPCGNDFLPGYGPFCSAPSASIEYENFDCDPETSD